MQTSAASRHALHVWKRNCLYVKTFDENIIELGKEQKSSTAFQEYM